MEPYKQLYYNILIYRTPLKKIDGADEALMNRCAVGLQYGVGFELGYKYLLNLTGQYGFTNMFKKSLTQENNKNLAFMITVGYRF